MAVVVIDIPFLWGISDHFDWGLLAPMSQLVLSLAQSGSLPNDENGNL